MIRVTNAENKILRKDTLSKVIRELKIRMLIFMN